MGRAAVRNAVTNYLEDANLPYVGTVFPARPSIIDEEDYEMSLAGSVETLVVSSLGSAAVLIVNIPSTKRSRHSLTGETFVSDFTIHEVELEVVLANTEASATDAQTDHDTLMDAMVATIRANPNLGSPTVVWAAGEFAEGVSVVQSPPFNGPNGGTVFIVAVVHIQVWEDIEAPAGT